MITIRKNILYFCLIGFAFVANAVTSGDLLVLPWTAFVLCFFGYAVFRHGIGFSSLVFFAATLTSIAIPLTNLESPGEQVYGLYNFSKLKFLGPISLSSLILILIVVVIILRDKIKIKIIYGRDIFRLFLVFFLFGNLSGIYYFVTKLYFDAESMIYYNVYIFHVILYLIVVNYSFSRLSTELLVKFVYSIIIASPIFVVISTLLGGTSSYSNHETAIGFEVLYFYPVIAYSKATKLFAGEKVFRLIEYASLPLFIYILSTGALGGKGIVFVSLIFFIRFSLFYPRLFACSLVGLLLFFYNIDYITAAMWNIPGLELFSYKFESALLLFKFVFEKDLWDLIPGSPRVRIFETVLIFDEIRKDVYSFLFGSGYGGTFRDSFDYFIGMDLTSSYPSDEISSGAFSRPHDSIPVLLHLHGVLGLMAALFVVYKYIRKSVKNPSFLAAIPLLLGSIYFNYQFALVAIILISIGEKLSLYDPHLPPMSQ